jgi:hypothetical protein
MVALDKGPFKAWVGYTPVDDDGQKPVTVVPEWLSSCVHGPSNMADYCTMLRSASLESGAKFAC